MLKTLPKIQYDFFDEKLGKSPSVATNRRIFATTLDLVMKPPNFAKMWSSLQHYILKNPLCMCTAVDGSLDCKNYCMHCPAVLCNNFI